MVPRGQNQWVQKLDGSTCRSCFKPLINKLDCSASLLKLLWNLSTGEAANSQGSTHLTIRLLEAKQAPYRFGYLPCRVVPSTPNSRYSNVGSNYSNKLFLTINFHSNDAPRVVLARGGTPYLSLLPLLFQMLLIEQLHSQGNSLQSITKQCGTRCSPFLIWLCTPSTCKPSGPYASFMNLEKIDFFELLDFVTIDCFFECFATSDLIRTPTFSNPLDTSSF
jgi:hypothetical protein